MKKRKKTESLLCKRHDLQLVMVDGLVIVTASVTSALVHLGGDGVGDVRELLLLLLEVLRGGIRRIVLQPVVGLLDSIKDLLRSLV